MHKPTKKTRKQVEAMAAVGISHGMIAEIIGVAPKTLRKHYRHELDVSMARANAAVAGKLYSSAMNGNVSAQIFWCKTRLGWRETQGLEISEREDFSKLTDTELQERMAELERKREFIANAGRGGKSADCESLPE